MDRKPMVAVCQQLGDKLGNYIAECESHGVSFAEAINLGERVKGSIRMYESVDAFEPDVTYRIVLDSTGYRVTVIGIYKNTEFFHGKVDPMSLAQLIYHGVKR